MNITGMYVGASEAKRAVAQAKARAREDMYDKLETREGEKRIFALAKREGSQQRILRISNRLKIRKGEFLLITMK